MVRKRRRKNLPVPERQPLVRPMQPNEVWSIPSTGAGSLR